MTARTLSSDEQRLWGAVMATVRPLRAVVAPRVRVPAAVPATPLLPAKPAPPVPAPAIAGAVGSRRRAAAAVTITQAAPAAARTLDGSWDKRLGRGMVAPDASIDLHGHTLASAHAVLDAGLARSVGRGDRVLLLVTGRPPRPDSERPHARGAIRAAVADWLAASRHADAIAAVRGAHPRHGGAGALYIVLRRPRTLA